MTVRSCVSKLSILLALGCASQVNAQLSSGGAPASLARGGTLEAFAGQVPIELLPAPDIKRLLAEDEANGPFPYRYGDMIVTSIGLAEHGRWDQTADGAIVWRVEISSPGAHSLGLLFDAFELPEGAQVFVYNPDLSQILGAYTQANEQPNGMLAIQPIHGSRLVIEYVQAPGTTELPRLSVGHVVHDYRDLFSHLRTQTASRNSALCFIDINCPEGDPYQDIKRSVVEIIANGGQCSASLLNNTGTDGTPYMLTANHCGDQTNGIQIFGYERTGCSAGPSSSSAMTLSGSTLLASTPTYDSQLYLLNNTPPQSYAPYFAGWGRNINPPAPMIGIHHAMGLPKKISIDNSDAVRSSIYYTVQYDDGMVHGGSSGSPLFNGLKRVVGPACCVSNFVCGTQFTLYGRFDRFYTTRNLGFWLDPEGTDPQGIPGYDPAASAALAESYNGSGANPVLYTSSVPTLGSLWTADVDVASHPGATTSLILGRTGQSSGTFLSGGEVLIDFASTFLLQISAGVTGNNSSHQAPIPQDPSLAGAVAYTQAAILGGGVELTNAVKLTLN